MALCALVVFTLPKTGLAFLDFFGKASYSRSHDSPESYSQTISGATGIGIRLFPQMRIEGRYTIIKNFQNQPATLLGITDLTTQTNIYSVSLDWDIVSEKYPVQPYLLLGAGYLQTYRTYSYPGGAEKSERHGVSANGGAGIRIHLGRQFLFEIEGFAYVADPGKTEQLIDVYGNVGLRFAI
jgi:hypothetical protein